MVPSNGQLYRSLKRCSSNAPASAGATTITPSPSRSAVSTESARRPRSGFGCSGPYATPSSSARRTTSRSTTTSIVWRLYLSSVARLVEVEELAVDTNPHEALPAGGLEHAVALGLAVLDQRPEDEQARALGQRQDPVHDLGHALAGDLAATDGAVRVTGPREQQAQVVVDLGDGADRGAGVPAGALLVDGDRGAQPVDLVDVRLLHLAQELARVRGEALDVPALALGVDRVERQARLAAARQARDHDEPVARQLDGDVLEVVFACSANDEQILRHTRPV